jgi:hypothetical protein
MMQATNAQTLPAIFRVTATYQVVDLDGTITGTPYAGAEQTTDMIMTPGQSILSDARKIISVLIWSTNEHADLIKINDLSISDF